MKTSKLLYSLLPIMALCALLITSCSKKDDVAAVTQSPVTGSWRLSLYFDNSDETNKFSGYNFTFNSNGQLTATNGSNTVTGTWSQGSTKFNIDFGTTAVFSDLNDDWLTVETTTSGIKLKDDNPSKDERLEFVKL